MDSSYTPTYTVAYESINLPIPLSISKRSSDDLPIALELGLGAKLEPAMEPWSTLELGLELGVRLEPGTELVVGSTRRLKRLAREDTGVGMADRRRRVEPSVGTIKTTYFLF